MISYLAVLGEARFRILSLTQSVYKLNTRTRNFSQPGRSEEQFEDTQYERATRCLYRLESAQIPTLE